MLGRCSRSFGRRTFSSMASSAPALRPFHLALIQLGQIGSDKTKNIAHAREQVLKAASREDGPKPQLIVLPVSVTISVMFGTGTLKSTGGRRQECFNSPYGATHFPAYAETIGHKPGEPYDPATSESYTVRMLSAVAKETGTWLVGGTSVHVSRYHRRRFPSRVQDLYPRERYLRGISTTPLPYIHPKVRVHLSCCLVD
jgi:hypothetical protein